MIEIIIALVLIQLIGLLIFKPKHNTLGCGIFAWTGKNPKVFNKDKYNILGIFNDSRGGHSCGVSIDGEIYNGIDKHKKFQDWISDFSYDNPKKTPIVIGHTRFATGGEHNVANAHPFGFGNNEALEAYEFIGVHNGSLLNHKDFCKNYDVEDSEKQYKNPNFPSMVTWRWKIDSELLLESIYKSGNFKVLSEYNGAAALVFTNTNEPNVLYCFHGASKMEKYDTGEKIFEERPLWYYKKGKNDLYISSIPESLEVIGGEHDKTLFEFNHNTLYKITDGDIDNAEKIRIVRSECFQKSTVTYSSPRQSYTNPQVSSGFKRRQEKKAEKQRKKEEITNINDEKVDPALHFGKVYMERLRYKRNGHPITGVYTWIANYGFFYLSDSVKTANEGFWLNVGKPFDYSKGEFLTEYKGTNLEIEKQHIAIPLDTVNPILMYFYKGIMLQEELDYKICKERAGTKDEPTFVQLSYMSKHPIIDESFGNKVIQRITKDDKLFTGNIQPLESGKIYNITAGALESISIVEKISLTDIVIPLTSGIDLGNIKEDVVYDDIEEIEDNFIEMHKGNAAQRTLELGEGPTLEEIEAKREQNINEFLLDEKLEKTFTPILMNLQSGKRDLQKFLPMVKAQTAVDTIDFFVESVEELVIKEEK